MEILFYKNKDGDCPFGEWLDTFDFDKRIKIDKIIDKLKDGSYGDYKLLEKSAVVEFKFSLDKNYRMYYSIFDSIIVIFFILEEEQVPNDIFEITKKCNVFFEDFILRTLKRKYSL